MKQFLDSISKKEVQDFLVLHENDDVQKLLLKQKSIHGVPTDLIALQILGRRKAKTKLPTWFGTKGIVYSSSLNLEQSSSEATAEFKSYILKSIIPNAVNAADLTGGFGVDTFYLSRMAHHFHYSEPDTDLLEIVRRNHHLLGAANIEYHSTSAEAFLQSATGQFDFIFLDPSRRKAQQKIYRLADSEPDVLRLLLEIFSKTNHVLIKTSPLLDLRQGFRELAHVAEVFVVAVANECRELLFHLKNDFSGEAVISAVDLNADGEIVNNLKFTPTEEAKSIVTFSPPLTYLYEPSAAMLKAGAFKYVAQKYQLKKLAVNTHLYTSTDQRDFPGRIFKIVEFLKPDKKLKDRFVNGHVNIISRNHPLSVEEIKKRTGLKEGGTHYLICTQDEREKLVMVAERLK